MKILCTPAEAAVGGGAHFVLLFGGGLVGGAVSEALQRAGAVPCAQVRLPWGQAEEMQRALEEARAALRERVRSASAPVFSLVWAAGRAGFASPEAQHQAELEDFKRVARWGETLLSGFSESQGRFFHVSSAGGLFEGQRLVDGNSQPQPLRAYGAFKLLQEDEVWKFDAYGSRVVYRPSTVYGFAPGGRVGLILALLRNGVRRAVTFISGDPATLRDYVFHKDVGNVVASDVLAAAPGPPPRQVRLLASGKPSSLQEVCRVAEHVLGRRLYVSYERGPQNALHNTYRPADAGLCGSFTGLREGMQQVMRCLLQGAGSGGR